MLRVTAAVDYAVRATVVIASNGGRPMTASDIARAEQFPAKFLGATLATLRRADILRSRRGGNGGFWLARPPEQISVGDIVRAISGQISETAFARSARTEDLWNEIAATVSMSLDRRSIADLMDRAAVERSWQ